MVKLRLFWMLLLIPLMGCANQQAVSSKALYECREWPKAPDKPRTQKDVSEYIVDGFSAWQSCKNSLELLKGEKK